MARIVAFVLAILAGPAVGWEVRSFDDGSFFVAGAYSGNGMSILCGERSPRGISPAITGNTEPDITRPGELRIELDPARISTSELFRNDLMFVTGTTGYRLPEVQYDELFGRWQVGLPASDPVFAALAGSTEFELRGNGVSIPLSGTGFQEAYAGLTRHCQQMFAAIGKPWRGGVAAPAQSPALSMRAAAEAGILKGCGGPAVKLGKVLLPAEIDGDGMEDVVLDWDKVSCHGGVPRPFCGAANCSADVYLSSTYGRTGRPEGLLGRSVGLVPLSNGNSGLSMGLPTFDCVGDACFALWYWNGAKFSRLN